MEKLGESNCELLFFEEIVKDILRHPFIYQQSSSWEIGQNYIYNYYSLQTYNGDFVRMRSLLHQLNVNEKTFISQKLSKNVFNEQTSFKVDFTI